MKTNPIALVLGLVLVASFSVPAVAQTATNIENVHGIVNEVSPIYSTYVQKTPITEQICHEEEIPVYSNSGGDSDDGELEGLIIGGLVGSAIGNKVSDDDGGGTAGAVVGALLGREAARENNRNRRQSIVGYRLQNVCKDVTRVREERIEEVTGYELDVIVAGQSISIKTDGRRHFEKGDTIRLTRRTSYSLR